MQPLIHIQLPLLKVQEMQFWLDKAVAWGQADSPDTQKDASLHLSRLSNYLQQLLTHINDMVSRYCKKLSSYLHSNYFVNFVTVEVKL